ncbi:MAG TPA: alpha/beta fold hydrolase [Gemmatimonadaceae bacterium]|nr:alpha/beta fold hydrolase [Gemmatimonadaceae bacterium]
MPNTAEFPAYATGERAALIRAVEGGRHQPALRVEKSSLHTIVVDGRRIAYREVGDADAPAVVMAHCSGGSHREWVALSQELSGRYRVIVPDLIGYGASEPWPANAPLRSFADVDVLVAFARLSRRPVHLVGHSYGGAVALDAARVLGARVRSLTLIEPVAFHLLKPLGRISEWYEIHSLGERMLKAMRLRQDREAARLFTRYWLGAWSWVLMSRRARDRVVATIGKVAAEFEALDRRDESPADYRNVTARTQLIVGSRTQRSARAVVEELLLLLPNVTVRELKGAGHMSPMTHPREVNELIAAHLGSE